MYVYIVSYESELGRISEVFLLKENAEAFAIDKAYAYIEKSKVIDG